MQPAHNGKCAPIQNLCFCCRPLDPEPVKAERQSLQQTQRQLQEALHDQQPTAKPVTTLTSVFSNPSSKWPHSSASPPLLAASSQPQLCSLQPHDEVEKLRLRLMKAERALETVSYNAISYRATFLRHVNIGAPLKSRECSSLLFVTIVGWVHKKCSVLTLEYRCTAVFHQAH